MTYATIPIFGGQTRILYREDKFSYTISDSTNPIFFPIYDENANLGNILLAVNTDEYSLVVQEHLLKKIESKKYENEIWKMFFDGASSKDGSGVGIILVSPSK
jgi:hypothetical protein